MKAKKIMAVLVIAIMLIGIVSVPVLASTNEKVILKNSDNEYLIYFKEFCRKEFQFAISKDSKTAEADLNFVNSAKDQPASAAGTLNVAYIDEASFESIFGKNPTSLVAYIWVKDAEDNTVIKADKLDLNEAVTDKMIETVNGTTKRIDVDTEKQYQRNVVEDGVSKTVTVGVEEAPCPRAQVAQRTEQSSGLFRRASHCLSTGMRGFLDAGQSSYSVRSTSFTW